MPGLSIGVGLASLRPLLSLGISTPAPAPSPTPGTAAIQRITVGGDSWTRDYPGYYAGAYKEMRQDTLTFSMQGVGGSGTNDVIAREQQVKDSDPDLYHLGVGRNDLNTTFPYDTDEKWIAVISGHLDRLLAWKPTLRITMETLCAEQQPNLDAANKIYNDRRPNLNAWIRSQRGGRLTDVVDFAASPEIGNDADMMPTAIGPYCKSNDGLHLWDRAGSSGRAGHDIALEIFAETLDRIVAASKVPATTISQTSPKGSRPFTWQVDDLTGIPVSGFWGVERATGASEAAARANLAAGTLNGQATQLILADDLFRGDITLTDLTPAPSGPVALRARWGEMNGAGDIVWKPWSNTLTDTLV